MKALPILGVDSLDEVTRRALDLSFEKTFDILSEFAVDGAFLSKIETAFGSDYDAEKLEQLRQDFASNDLDWLPKFEIRSATELKGANAAFAAANNTVYLSQSFIKDYTSNSQRMTDVLLEELGHLIDSTINIEDTPGDEGEHFSILVQEKSLDTITLQAIKSENDFLTLYNSQFNAVSELNQSLYDEVEISFRSFIPSPGVTLIGVEIPDYLKPIVDVNFPLDDVFSGDSRGFRYDVNPEDDSRTFQQVTVTVDPNRESILVGNKIKHIGETTRYVNESFTQEIGKPDWWVNPTLSPPPLDPTDIKSRLPVSDENNRIDVRRISPSEIAVDFLLNASNPLSSGAPAIDADFTIYVREDNPEGRAEYRIEGDHDGFPAYELYINQKRVYEHDPIVSEQTPWSLFPPSEFDISTNEYETIPILSPSINPSFIKVADRLNDNLTVLETLTENRWSSLFSSNPVPFSSPEDRELQSFSTSESVSVEQSQIIQVEASYDSSEEYLATSPIISESSSILVETNSTQSEPNNFIGEMRDALVPIFRQLSNEDNLTSVQNLLFDALGDNGLKLVKSKDDIGVTGNLNGDFTVDLSLSSDLPLFERSLSADFGLPWLGLEVADGGTVKTAFNYEFDFSFGLQDGEFFFDVPEEEDLVITLDTSIPDVDFTGNLGFLQFDVTDEDADGDPNNDGIDVDGDGRTPSSVSLGAALDLDFSADTGIEISDVKETGEANINLELATSFDDSVVFPSVETDLEIALDILSDDELEIAFRDVQLGLGSFLSRIVGPTFGTIQTITDIFPLNEIVSALNKKQVLLGNLTIAEAAEKAGPFFSDVDFNEQTVEFIKIAAEISKIVEFINSISADDQNTKINFGDFEVDGSTVKNGGLSSATPDSPSEDVDFLNASEGVRNGFTSTLSDSSTNIEFPILTDPTTAFNLLLGKPVDLFNLDLPVLGLGFEYASPPIYIFGPLSLQIIGRAGAAANIDFGFDTYGLEQFQLGGYQDPSLIAQGLYIADPPTDSAPEPLDGQRDGGFALGLGAGIAADVGVDLGILRASVEAGINGTTYLDLLPDEIDLPNDDPRKYREGRKHILDFDSLGCVFEIQGGVDAVLAAKIRIGFGPFSFSKRITIVREPLVNFRAGCSGDGEEDGAVIEEDNVLKLKTTGGNDFIVLSHVSGDAGAETIDVESYSVEFPETESGEVSEDVTPRGVSSYADINLIKGDGKGGKDRFEIDSKVLTPAELKGGGNDDELIGGAGNDLLEGGDGEDYLSGGKGDDELNGGSGDDFIEGGEGDNLIDGKGGFDAVSYVGEEQGIEGELSPDDEGKIFIKRRNGQIDTVINVEQFDLTNHNDIMTGNDKDTKKGDIIDGLEGDDTLYGLKGDDFLIGGPGADTIDGGDGDDGTSYINSFAGVKLDLDSEFADGGEATGDKLISIEHVLLTIHDDIARGNGKKNIINGSDGDDLIEGRGGGDELDGGGVRRNGINFDVDELSYESSSEGVAVSLKDGNGDKGDAKGDEIAFAIEVTSVFNLESGKTEDVLSEDRSPYSSFENLTGSGESDSKLEGDIGDNEIKGLEGNDNLYGDGGDDTLVGGVGADFFDGGEGIDWADYSNASSGVGVDQLFIGFRGEALGDTFKKQNGVATAENLKGSRYGDSLWGDNGDNEIDPDLSSGETDFVNGRGGNDLLIINYGIRNDWGSGITGGFNSASATSGFISRGRTDFSGEIADDSVQFLNIERSKIIGTFQADTIQGGGGVDTIYGGSGDDEISGGDSNDVLYGDDGNDTLEGGLGADSIRGGEGIDTASYRTALFSGVYIDLEESSQKFVDLDLLDGIFTSDAVGDQLSSIENLRGSVYGDVLLGNDDINELYGDSGNDSLNGRGGADLLDGGSGRNSAVYSSSLEAIEVYLETGEGFGGDAEGDTLINIQNVTGSDQDDSIYGDSSRNILRGQDGDDLLQGEGGNDSLLGSNGSDTLIGGSGNDLLRGSSSDYDWQEVDILTGGSGADEFYLGNSSTDYYKYSNSYAVITDFNPLEDTIYLHSGLENCNEPGATPDYYLEATEGTLPQGTGIYTTGDSGTPNGRLIGIIQNTQNLDITNDYFAVISVRENYCDPILG